MASASSWSWVTMMVVMPSRRCSVLISSRRRTRTRASSADSGSSSSSSEGEDASARAKCHALLLPARQLNGIFAALLGQADQRQQLGHAGRDLAGAPCGG